MQHYIIIILLITIFSLSAKAQEPENTPTIYRILSPSPFVKTGELSIINALSLEEMKRISFGESGYIGELTANKKNLFVAHFNNFVTNGLVVIDLEKQRPIKELFQGIRVDAIKSAPDGTVWVLLGNEQKIALVNQATLEILPNLPGLSNIGQVRDIVFHPQKEIAYVSLENSNILIIDTNKKVASRGVNNLLPGKIGLSRPMELAISPDGNMLVIASKNTITLIDTSSLRPTNSFNFENKSPFELVRVTFNKAGNSIYVAEIGGRSIYRCDIPSSTITKIFTTIAESLQDIKLSPDGRLLYVSDFGGRSIIDTFDQTTILSERDLFNTTEISRGIALAGDFSIGQAPSLTTIFPSSNQQVTPNQAITIRWNTSVAVQSYSIASHKIELSTDGGTTFAPITKAESLPADAQEFIWQVPDIEVINKAQIRVSTVDLGARRASSSSGNFSITKGGGQTGDSQAPSVIFLSPKGSEKFNSGDNLQISWMSNDNVGVTSQDLSLSTDGGNTFPITIANGLPGNSQSFSFLIPSTLQTNQARLRLIVRDAANNSSQALTQANFLIESAADTTAPIVTISQPTVNQSLIAGQPIQVNWQSTDNKAVVSQGLLLSLDGGKTFATVANFGASDNSFVIRNIEELNVTNSQGIVRITATDSSGNIGQANVQFSISPAIINATYQAKILTLMGIGFLSNSTNSTTKLFVNNKEVTLKPTNLSNNSFTIKGNKKKLGIVKGNNSVRLVVDGVESNSLMFSF